MCLIWSVPVIHSAFGNPPGMSIGCLKGQILTSTCMFSRPVAWKSNAFCCLGEKECKYMQNYADAKTRVIEEILQCAWTMRGNGS